MAPYVTQAIHLRKDAFSKGEAYAWIREHGYKPIKAVHTSPHFYMFRLVDPDRIKGARFRTIELGKVGEMIVAYL